MPSRPGFYFRDKGEFHLGDFAGRTIKVLRLSGPSQDSVPLVGRWTFLNAGDRAGFYYPAGLKFYLGTLGGEGWERVVQWDPALSRGDVPLIGKWTLFGIDEPGLYRRADSRFIMADLEGRPLNSITMGSPNNGGIPLVGKWNGNTSDTPVLYHRGSAQFQYFLSGNRSEFIPFGDPGNPGIPFVADWDDSGTDKPGLYFPETSEFHFRNVADGTGKVVPFGDPNNGGIPVVGDWGAYSTFRIEVTENGRISEVGGTRVTNASTVPVVVVAGGVAIEFQPYAVMGIEQVDNNQPARAVIYEIRPQDPSNPVQVGEVALNSGDAVPQPGLRLTPTGQIN